MLTAVTRSDWLLDHELGVLEVLPEGGLLGAFRGLHLGDGLEVGEDPVADPRQHGVRAELAEVGPAQLLLIGAEDALEGPAGAGGALLVAGLRDVEQAREHQEGDLLDDGERIGDAAGPEIGPELVDSAFQLACDHFCGCSLDACSMRVVIDPIPRVLPRLVRHSPSGRVPACSSEVSSGRRRGCP